MNKRLKIKGLKKFLKNFEDWMTIGVYLDFIDDNFKSIRDGIMFTIEDLIKNGDELQFVVRQNENEMEKILSKKKEVSN